MKVTLTEKERGILNNLNPRNRLNLIQTLYMMVRNHGHILDLRQTFDYNEETGEITWPSEELEIEINGGESK